MTFVNKSVHLFRTDVLEYLIFGRKYNIIKTRTWESNFDAARLCHLISGYGTPPICYMLVNPKNIIVCRAEGLNTPTPTPTPTPTLSINDNTCFYLFSEPTTFGKFFWQYRAIEIPDKHKNKFVWQSYFFIFRKIKNNVKCFLKKIQETPGWDLIQNNNNLRYQKDSK